jgi:hypothetical protein
VTAQIAFSGNWGSPNPVNHNSKISDKSLENVANFKYVGKTMTKKLLS